MLKSTIFYPIVQARFLRPEKVSEIKIVVQVGVTNILGGGKQSFMGILGIMVEYDDRDWVV